MDLNALLPDFSAIGKTDWSKTEVKFDTKDVPGLAAIGGAALMLIFVFLPWCKATWLGQTGDVHLGITTWYGILGFIMALVAVAGSLYKQYSITFWAAVLGVLFGVIGMIVVPDASAEELELAKMLGIEVSHVGAILYLVACLVAGAGAFLKVTK